jgi:hypothetical protein
MENDDDRALQAIRDQLDREFAGSGGAGIPAKRVAGGKFSRRKRIAVVSAALLVGCALGAGAGVFVTTAYLKNTEPAPTSVYAVRPDRPESQRASRPTPAAPARTPAPASRAPTWTRTAPSSDQSDAVVATSVELVRPKAEPRQTRAESRQLEPAFSPPPRREPIRTPPAVSPIVAPKSVEAP